MEKNKVTFGATEYLASVGIAFRVFVVEFSIGIVNFYAVEKDGKDYVLDSINDVVDFANGKKVGKQIPFIEIENYLENYTFTI